MIHMNTKITAIFAVLLFTAATAWATTPQTPKKKTVQRNERLTATAHNYTERMKGELRLNEEQTKQLYEKSLRQLRQMHARSKKHTNIVRNIHAIEQILTPEQRELWQRQYCPSMNWDCFLQQSGTNVWACIRKKGRQGKQENGTVKNDKQPPPYSRKTNNRNERGGHGRLTSPFCRFTRLPRVNPKNLAIFAL